MRKFWITAVMIIFLGATVPLSPPVAGQLSLRRFTGGTLTSQLEIIDGTANDPSIVFTSYDDGTGTGIYSATTDSVTISANGGIAFQFFRTNVRGPDGTVSLPGYTFGNDTNSGIYSIGGDNLGLSVGGGLVLDLENTNAAGAGANLATISSTLGIMDNSDAVIGLSIELTNADHTGSANTVDGINIAAITGDAEATEVAINIGTGWDQAIVIGDGAAIEWEGATANTEELLMQVSDPTADVTVLFRQGLDSADTYNVMATPDGERATANYFPPWMFNDHAVANLVAGDNVMVVYRLYIPYVMQATDVHFADAGGADSSTDDTLAVAFYEDADAGVRIATAQTSDLSGSAALIEISITDIQDFGPGWFRIAFCAQDVSAADFESGAMDADQIDIINMGGTILMGTATNPCDTGTPPTTTGAIVDADIRGVWFAIE